ncbi:Platinum sensitivity protein [Coemansia sp. RSA 2320]|nr:Platinum sensitivity protein [Coemansia sp. RSA 2320]
MSAADSQVRVKVYYLEDGSNWADRGTGFCTLEDCQGELHLSVVSESEPNRAILDCVVQRGEVYQQQESTLIVWTEPTGEDLALSFQEQEGCLSIFPPNRDVVLPQPSMQSLGEIERLIGEASQSLYQRDRLVAFILKDSYLAQLESVHEICEDLEAAEELYTLYNIARRIVLLNDSSIFEHIIRDENIIGFIGMLEYDPRHPVERGAYREFLRSGARFKEAVPIGDSVTESRIHQTFRLQYLKDVVLPGILDDGTLPVVNALIFFNNAQITNYLQNNDSLLKILFDTLHEPVDAEKKSNVVMFVRQFCALLKTLPAVYRAGMYRTLSQHGLFHVFEYAFQASDQSLQVAAADVLIAVLEQDRALVRSHALAQMRQDREGASLLSLVIQGAKRDIGSGVQLLCCEILRLLLDTMPSSVDAFDMPAGFGVGGQAASDTEDFLAMFYEQYVHSALGPLLNATAKEVEGLGARDKHSVLYVFLCELLSSMMRFHGFRARSFIISSGVFDSICLLFSAKHSFLKLAALRFFRSCIGLQDDVYNKYLTSNHLLTPIVELFVKFYPRDNLMTSACRELFAFVAGHRISPLLSHLLGAHSKALERAPEVLESLRQAYNDHLLNMENAKNGGMSTPTVDTSRRSALSISVIVGRENSVHGSLSMPTTGEDGPWGSHVADDIEDAYLEAAEDESDLAEDSESLAKVPSRFIRRGQTNENKVPSAIATQSPELDVLQDCLEQYTGGDSKHLLGRGSAAASKAGMIRGKCNGGSPNLSVVVSKEADSPELLDLLPVESAGALSMRASSLSCSKAPPLKRHSSTYDLATAANGTVGSSGTSDGSLKASRHISVAEAFPESRPISRKLSTKLGSKRLVVGRLNAKGLRQDGTRSSGGPGSNGQTNGETSKQILNGSNVSDQDLESPPDRRSAVALGKRSLSMGSVKRYGVGDAPSSSPPLHTSKLGLQLVCSEQQRHSRRQRFSSGGGVSNEGMSLDRRAEDSMASVRRSSGSCSQSSSPIGILTSSPTEAKSPPKKAKTASL